MIIEFVNWNIQSTQSIQIQDVQRDCIQSKKGTTGFPEKSALPLLKNNSSVSKTSEDSMDIISLKNVPIKMNHSNGRRCEKKESLGRKNDRKRLFLNTDFSSTVASYAYMNSDETHPGRHQTLIFDIAKTIVGSAYNTNSELFTSPDHGIYVSSGQ
ncbi:Hypothetical predicted protein [Mytilus galloprovincialis]|uniref:Uncharacterized protein n=1 Tax=Mytilus galloprovincialis TaxID=29158 RepID=A0A8B6BQQ3_MYTGA|nr:Hypothetical predicted protein [Mytilus galloprovincialis]